MTRPGWDQYFMTIARAVATRATCDRKRVGAVIVGEQRILATGYNGAPKGWPSCDEAGHELQWIGGGAVIEAARHLQQALGAAPLGEFAKLSRAEIWDALTTAFHTAGPRQSCVRTIHAEENAVIHAARHGARLAGATLYTTASPCYDCFKMVANTGIVRIVYGEAYASARTGVLDLQALAQQVGIELVLLEDA